MKKEMRKLLMVLLVSLLTAVACASCAEAKRVVVTLSNQTGKPIFMAFAREGYGDDKSTRGWYKLDDWELKEIRLPYEYDADDYYYFYAFSGKTVWTGKDFTGWIHPKDAFKSEMGRRVPGGKQVGFRRLKVGKNGKASLRFTIKR